jgi:transcription initiation factor IIE alpha subunit
LRCLKSQPPLTHFCHRLHAEDLAFLMGMQQKDLRKLCARLREDRLIAV